MKLRRSNAADLGIHDAYGNRSATLLCLQNLRTVAFSSASKLREFTKSVMSADAPPSSFLPTVEDAETDVAALTEALGLQKIRRYLDQKHWAEESSQAHAADLVEPGLKLENVAAHSWHVADAALLLVSHFKDIHARRAIELAVLHDKLELITGDFDPVGADGQGTDSHAFDPVAQAEKISAELAALDRYLLKLRVSERKRQQQLLLEIIHNSSAEAHFVNAVDKLQALVFVVAKKDGRMTDEHLAFSLKYSAKVVQYFPRLSTHYRVLVRQLIETVALYRHTSVSYVISALPQDARDLAELNIR